MKLSHYIVASGKYWLISNRHNNDDVKLMNWLMNGANHGTIDTCGENVTSMPPLNDAKGGICLLKGGGIDNIGIDSKLLKMELGQQIPIKMKRDVIKRARANHGDYYSEVSDTDYSCWYHRNTIRKSSHDAGGLIEYALSNSRLGLFDECVTQKFYMRNPCNNTLIKYRVKTMSFSRMCMVMQMVIKVIS